MNSNKILNLKNMNLFTNFKSALDFRKSLEARLQALAIKTKEDLQRLRRKVAFDRFLARIFSQGQTGFFLKGGYAMELRIAHARATRDIDLTFIKRVKDEIEILNALIFHDLQTLASIDLQDHFVYNIGKSKMDLENAPYGGWRNPVTALIQNKIFAEFHVDLGGDFLLDETETIYGTDWLQFSHIPPPAIPMISMNLP